MFTPMLCGNLVVVFLTRAAYFSGGLVQLPTRKLKKTCCLDHFSDLVGKRCPQLLFHGDSAEKRCGWFEREAS